MAIDFWYSWNFVSIKDVIRTYNLTVRFSKSTINIKIFDEFVPFLPIQPTNGTRFKV